MEATQMDNKKNGVSKLNSLWRRYVWHTHQTINSIYILLFSLKWNFNSSLLKKKEKTKFSNLLSVKRTKAGGRRGRREKVENKLVHQFSSWSHFKAKCCELMPFLPFLLSLSFLSSLFLKKMRRFSFLLGFSVKRWRLY